MDLQTWIDTSKDPVAARQEIATACSISYLYSYQYSGGQRRPRLEGMLAIERATRGQVTPSDWPLRVRKRKRK